MIRKTAILLASILLFSLTIYAQTNVNLDPEFGGRVAISVDKRIVNGLHVSLEEEIRFDNNFGSFDRLQTTLGVNYKVHPNIKLGLGYAMINGYSSSSKSFKNLRHRMMADVTGILHLGRWNVALRERFQVTRRTGDYNIYQNPQNAMMLKSRLSVRYNSLGRVDPYAYFEIRNYLNAPVIEAAYDGDHYYTLDDYSRTGEPGWFLTGFNGGYINRLRFALGMDVRLTRRSTINIYFLSDYVMDKVVDANSEGTKLKSYTYETGLRGWVGAGYEFAF